MKEKQNNNQSIEFSIEHMDSLGQGVSKLDNRILFVPKTLPEEKGSATVYRHKGKVSFAQLSELSASSPERIKPDCEYFEKCGGCQYLHTNYENELSLKVASFQRELQLFLRKHPNVSNEVALQLHPAPNRFGYRNRVQLHYDLEKNRIGFHQTDAFNITPISSCLVANEAINIYLQDLMENQRWTELVTKQMPKQGHLEIYEINGKIQVSLNQAYAASGFSQVNPAMNQVLKESVFNLAAKYQNNSSVVDLFGGNGNLTNQLTDKKVSIFDQFTQTQQNTSMKNFFDINLYQKQAVQVVKNHLKNETISLLVLDPPRTGLANLNEFVKLLKPKECAYISCNYQTQFRDLSLLAQIHKIKLTAVELFDFFPGTRHLESMISFETN